MPLVLTSSEAGNVPCRAYLTFGHSHHAGATEANLVTAGTKNQINRLYYLTYTRACA